MRKLVLSLLVLLAACAAQGGDQAGGQAREAAPDDTLARIHALIGSPDCTEDSQCRSLAIGQRPCGGPESYLAYSTARSSEAEVKALGAIYQAERRQANAQAGRVSDCRFAMDPGAVCRAGKCELGAGQPVAR